MILTSFLSVSSPKRSWLNVARIASSFVYSCTLYIPFIWIVCVCYIDSTVYVCLYAYECVKLNRTFVIRTYKRLRSCVEVLRRWWSCLYQAWYKIALPPNNTRFGLKRYIVGMMLHIPMITRRIKDPKNTTRRQDEVLFHMSVFLLYVRRCL